LNEAQAIVHPLQKAISDTSGEVAFRSAGLQGDNHIVSAHEANTVDVIRTPAISIDEFCATQKIQPHLIKVDVEGYELDVLRGAKETIRSCREHLALFVEMHPTTWGRLGIIKDDIVAELRRQNLQAQPLVQADDPWLIEGCCMRLTPVA
jgi:FkbM family methyltransferase